mmetsp:Transcript_139486/g.445164  ORF Transcript_139486/g.445164 Transcript_139486/m.445164 type:complete len:209 (+) Transcript_139486:224-850(+)
MRQWSQRIDRASRHIQGWCRRRWVAQGLLREAERLRVRKMYPVDRPPPPPSQMQRPRLLGSLEVREDGVVEDMAAKPATPRAGSAVTCPAPLPRPHEEPRMLGPDFESWRDPTTTALRSLRATQHANAEAMLLLKKPSVAGASVVPKRGFAAGAQLPGTRMPRAGGTGPEPPRCALPSLRRPSPSCMRSDSFAPRLGAAGARVVGVRP